MTATLLCLLLTACNPFATAPTGHDDHDEHEEAGGHDHDEHGEASDLDQSVSDLFAADCEHEMKAHACDECRYEVGVVKAPDTLFQGGLLESTRAEERQVAVPLQLTGEVQFDERLVTHVSTQAEGIIREVHITLGDVVERGQAMLEIDSVEVGEAEAAYLEARGLLDLAERNHSRIETLHNDGITSEREEIEAHQELATAQIRAEAALGKLTRLGVDPSTARAMTHTTSRGRLVLRAPSDGAVLTMHAVAGEVAKAEESLVTVGDNEALWVWADLYERDLALVTREQSQEALAAEIEVKAFPGEVFNGTVDFVSPSMDTISRTVKLRIAVPNPDRKLLAGMFASVAVYLPGDQLALTVPSASVMEDEGRSFVFVHHQGDFWVRRPVAPGRRFAGRVEITHGLDGSETLVSDGAFLLKSDVLRSKMGAGCAD